MLKKDFAKLARGFKDFKKNVYSKEDSVYGELSKGQSPKTLVIGCSDSRVDPVHLGSTQPGELFVIRNVANLVPPFEEPKGSLHGVSAAIEFAVVHLKVEHIVILGHRQCGGIKALLFPQESQAGGFVRGWMNIAEKAKDRAFAELGTEADHDELCRHCEKEAIKISVDNLLTFAFVKKAVEERGLEIYGLYFDLETGDLWALDQDNNSFVKVI